MASSSSSTLKYPVSSERKASLAPQARNPVSLRLYKVLGTNFNDQATREALSTLSDLYAISGPSTLKDSRTRLENNDDDELHEDASKPQSGAPEPIHESVPGESAARARKNLRRDMERMLAEGSRQFLKAFGEVDQRLDELQKHVDAMRVDCDKAEAQLKLTNEASSTLLERAGSLREERQEVEDKRTIISLFLARFTLSEEEAEALTSRDVPIAKRFFDAMDKTERIRSDCRVLMSGEDGPTQAGLDIMAATASYLEQGYEKILRWCSREFEQMARDTHLEVSFTLQEAVRRLRRRPELLTESLTSLSQTRQTTLMSSFLTALTRGGPSGLPRPIELHAHDPMRYVGDMLAWVHQAIAAEREFLESLFDLKGDGRMVGSVRVFSGDSEEEGWIRELMDLSVGKLCVPLKVRVQQTIRSQESSILSFKIANLLQFYMLTMRRTIGEHAILSTTLQEITDVAYKVFYDTIEGQGRTLLRSPVDLNDLSLTPTAAILEHVQILREIMSVYQSSLLGDEPELERMAGFQRILDIMIDPVVYMCAIANEVQSRLRPRWDQPVYILNCLSYLMDVLEPYSFTLEKQKMLQNEIEKRVRLMIDDHFSNLITDAGINTVFETCKNHQNNEPLSRIPSTQPAELQTALHAFSLWLSGPEVVQSPRLSHLTVQRLHMQIHHAALARVVRAYELICREVRKAENRYEAASTLLGSERPFGQVHLLRQIFGLEEE